MASEQFEFDGGDPMMDAYKEIIASLSGESSLRQPAEQEIPGELYTARIPEEVLSRGTGEEVPRDEVTTFDVMPQIIGSTFLTNDELRARMHLHGESYGPYLVKETAYLQFAEQALASGNLIDAIDAYRRALHYATRWVSAVAALGDRILLTKEDVDRLNLDRRFSGLEARLVARIWDGEVAFNPDEYTDFVRTARRLEKQCFQLHQLFFFGSSEAFEPMKVAGKYDPTVGREYIDTCVAMGRFQDAAWAAKRLGWKDEEAELTERAKNGPQDSPRLTALLESERIKFEMDRD